MSKENTTLNDEDVNKTYMLYNGRNFNHFKEEEYAHEYIKKGALSDYVLMEVNIIKSNGRQKYSLSQFKEIFKYKKVLTR